MMTTLILVQQYVHKVTLISFPTPPPLSTFSAWIDILHMKTFAKPRHLILLPVNYSQTFETVPFFSCSQIVEF